MKTARRETPVGPFFYIYERREVSSSNTKLKRKKALAEASAFLELLSRFEPPCISAARCPLEDPIGGQEFKY